MKNRIKIDILQNLYKDSIADELDRLVNINEFNQNYWHSVYSKYISLIKGIISVKDDISVLDIGCGSGSFCKEVAYKFL